MRNPFKRGRDPFAPGAYSDVIRSVRTRERKHMRHWWQWALLAFFALVVAAAGYGIWKYYDTQCKISCGGIDLPDPREREPFNALLIGSDSRKNLTPQEQEAFGAAPVPGQRADTIILAHVDPEAQFVTMAQFPRDLFVEVAGRGTAKINSSLEGGPRRVVETVEALTGLEINRYVIINIAGFRDLVDAIGGVDVCIREPIPFDPNTGLEVEQPGIVHFNGIDALSFVRSRHFTTGDFERIQNQQIFLSAAFDKVTSLGTFLNPARLNRLADVAGENVRADKGSTILGLQSLLSRFRALNPGHYEAYTVPHLGIGRSDDGQSIVLPDEEAMELMFDAMAANQSPQAFDGVPDIDPAEVKLGVYNGTFEDGVASVAADALVEATDSLSGDPVTIVEIENADRFGYKRTVIRYTAETKPEAELVSAVAPGVILKEVERLKPGVDVEVIVGAREFETKRLVQLTPIPIPPPSEPPPECR